MKGDFTRGFNPDTKRGEHYRRVLLQQGRAVLDSDMAALSDAIEGSLRQNLAMVAGDAGSSDLGLLVTPGRLLTQFDGTLGNDFIASGGAEVVRDYSRKYLDWLPGLRMGTGGQVSIALATPLEGPTDIRIWARADNGGANPLVNGTPVAVPSGPDYQPVDATVDGTDIVIDIDPASRIWVAMIETRADSTTDPVLHGAAGNYEVGGLAFETQGGAWPALPDPAGADIVGQSSPAAPGTRFIAYVEVWERHISALEDPGIRETALGGDLDTTTRTELRHQVKLAEISGLADADAVSDAFANRLSPTGTLTLGTATETLTADPCDLPTPGGYTGPDNRLYRLETHENNIGAVLFKWSRENGSELYRAWFPDDGGIPPLAASLSVPANSDLRDGDLVELLSDATDLGDAAPGTLDASGFTRPERRVGRLLRLSGGEEITGSTRIFDLRDPLDETSVTDIATAEHDPGSLKLRRWSGLIRHSADNVYELEHGIEADIAGTAFEPGDWWQYEARVFSANANGPVLPAPHGPERLFAPLAILQQTPAGNPMLLEAWLDKRFPKLCEIEADDVSYDGARVDSDSITVQEALDELFERETGDGCGEIPVPEGGDIRDIIDAIPDGGDAKICLGPGTRPVPSVIEVFDKGHITITGIGLGSLLTVRRPTFYFRNCRAVTLVDFSIDADGTGQSILRFDDCGQIDVQRLVIRSRAEVFDGAAAIRITTSDDGRTRSARLRDCRMELGHNDTGILAVGVRDVEASGCDIEVPGNRFDLSGRVASDDIFASTVGHVFLSQLSFNVDTNIFVGGSVVSFSNVDLGRQNIAIAGWGRDPLRFSTHNLITTRNWDDLADANPPGNPSGGQPSMRAHIRRFRRGLIRAALQLPSPVTVPATARGRVRAVGIAIRASGTLTHGQTGIVIAAPRGPTIAGERDPSTLIDRQDAQSVRINGNRISGFQQGIRIAGNARNTVGFDTQRTVFRDVEVDGNRVDIRPPMYARSRWGIMVGSSVSVAVRNNRVNNLIAETGIIDPDRPVPVGLAPTDGIRLWGVFGSYVQLERNACFGTTHGVRFRALNPQPDLTRSVWKISDQTGTASIPANALSGGPGQAEIVNIP